MNKDSFHMKHDINDVHGEETFAARLAVIVRNSGMLPSHFAKEVGITQTYLTKLIFEGQKCGMDIPLRIIDRFPQYTLDWLTTGKKSTAPQPTTPTPPTAAPTPPAPAPALDSTERDQLIEYRTEARIYKKLYEDQMARLDTTLTNIERAMTEQEQHEETTDADAEATRRRQPETKPRKFGFSKAKNGDPIYTRGRKVVKEPH